MPTRIEIVALAASAGGIEAISGILRTLNPSFPAAVVVAMHLSPIAPVRLETFRKHSTLPVSFVEAGKKIEPARVYVAPAGHGVELEPDGTATLTPLPSSRYSIDATLTSVAESYGPSALAVVLTGMRDDGAAGARAVKERGGYVLVQSPDTATHPSMPEATIATGVVDLVVPLSDVGRMIETIVTHGVLPPTRARVAALDAVFGGPGEARRVLRAIDWSSTSLGPVETWPPELRAALGMTLGSASPATLYWGPEMVLFYNDAGIPIYGARHPVFAGRPFAVGWPDIFEQASKLMEGVRTTGEPLKYDDMLVPFAADEGFEERYFTASYCAVPTDRGIGGVFQHYVETTEGVLARRRLTTLSALAGLPLARSVGEAFASSARVLGQNPYDLPFVLAYEIGHAHRQARLKAHAGVPAGSGVAPQLVETSSPRAVWPLSQVIETRAPLVVDDLLQRFVDRIVGPWGEPTSKALLLPLSGLGDGPPMGVLVLGLNRRRRLDSAYREFLNVIGAHVSAGVVSAHAFETSRAREGALAEANRAKTEFFSNVSHEFRTPLTLILGPLERARASGRVPDEVAADLEVAERNARRLGGLVRTLLDLAAADANRLVPSFESVDLAAETRELASLFRSAVEAAGLAFRVECELERPVHIDRMMWAKIVVNLIANALKFTFEGEIRVELRERAKHAELVVSDTGVGISAEDRPHVFERFFRGRHPRARSHEGSGIGLALVHELVRRQRGRVRVQSEEGKGTTFTVWIPLHGTALERHRPAVAASEPEGHDATTALVAEEALAWTRPVPRPDEGIVGEPHGDSLEGLEAFRTKTAGARMLVVDDNADMRAYLTRLLSEAGWVVETAADGEEAFQRARSSNPDLVVADVMMPRADGFELLRRMRADDTLRLTPIVLVTARAGEASALEGLAAGANDYVAKPFSARELVARLGAQLEIAKLRRRAEKRDAFLLALSDAIRPLADAQEIMSAAARLVAARLGVDRVAYGEVSQDGTSLTVKRDHAARGLVSLVGTYRFADFPAPVDDLARGITFASEDVAHDERFSVEGKAVFAAMGSAATCSVPLVKGGRFVANLNLHHSKPRPWQKHEIALVEDVAERTWAAVERARAEAALRESEENFRALFEAMEEGYALCELVRDEHGRAVDHRFIDVNAAFEKFFGIPRERAVGRTRSEILPDAPRDAFEKYTLVVERGESLSFETYYARLERWYSVRVYPRGGDRFAVLYEEVTERKNAETARGE